MRWLIVPTTQSTSACRGENRAISAPKRDRSNRGLATAKYSWLQHAVANGYANNEYLRAQPTSASSLVVANPCSSPESVIEDIAWARREGA